MKKVVVLLMVILSLAAFAGTASAKARGYGIVFSGYAGDGAGVKDTGMPSVSKGQ